MVLRSGGSPVMGEDMVCAPRKRGGRKSTRGSALKSNISDQFIQCYDLNDEQIDELIQPTIDEIHDILRLDWRKAVLFLKGKNVKESTVEQMDNDFSKALMADRRIMDDPFVTKKIYELIGRRIRDAKIGVVNVHGNFSIICGDPYALCQSMFGLPVTGLLKAGELYNKYWLDVGAEKVACFRAPMSCAENVRKLTISRSEEAQYWFQHINTVTMLNAWDCTTHALNGADKDGDLVMLTDNRILVECMKELPALMCAQRKAKKVVPTEEDIIRSNIASFGDDIGKITNRVTAMYEIQSRYPPESREYQTLEFRIRSGQLFQQNAIDKAKGIISKPMPKYWYDRAAIWKDETMTQEEKEFQNRIVANKKPYFMRYIYPAVMKQYKTYIQNTDMKAMCLFMKTIPELEAQEERTAEEQEFLDYYHDLMPVGTGDSVMNKICRRFEQEFDRYIGKYKSGKTFDYTFMKSKAKYVDSQYRRIKAVLERYIQCLREYSRKAWFDRLSFDETVEARRVMVKASGKSVTAFVPTGTCCVTSCSTCAIPRRARSSSAGTWSAT